MISRIASIDIGSNTLHCAVFRVREDRSLQRIFSQSAFLGLGRIVAEDGTLSPSTERRMVRILKQLLQKAHQQGAQTVLIGATEATRRAKNGRAVLQRLSQRLDVPIRMLSREKEATLTFLGVSSHLTGKEHYLVLDVGGGSTEITWTRGRKRLGFVSLPMGSSALLAGIKQDPMGPLEWAGLEEPIQQALKRSPRDIRPMYALGIGGSSNHLPRLFGKKPGEALTMDDLNHAARMLLKHPSQELAKKYGIDPQRVRSMAPGVLIVGTILRKYHLDRLHVTPAGLREGMVVDYLAHGISESRLAIND